MEKQLNDRQQFNSCSFPWHGEQNEAAPVKCLSQSCKSIHSQWCAMGSTLAGHHWRQNVGLDEVCLSVGARMLGALGQCPTQGSTHPSLLAVVVG